MMETMSTPEKRTYSRTTMNTKTYFAYAAALVLMAACQAEKEAYIEETAPQTTEQKVVAPEITAVQESGNDTKSVLDVDGEGVGTIYWTPADEINVFYGTTSTHYVSQNAVNATTAVFTTTDVIGSTESASENIWGLYPYNSSATCTGSAVTTTLPATQYGVPGTFDEDLFITLAHNTTTALKFYNVCGGIKFSLSRDDITEITFRGNNNEDIAGDISLNFVDGLPNVSVTSGAKEITLTPKVGSTFTSGEDYYLILRPVTLSNGFTMCFSTLAGNKGVFNLSSSSITIKRSVFAKKANIDSYAAFPAPSNQIWYTSTDGEVITPYKIDAFGANIISNTYSDGKGIITFDDDVTNIANWAFYNCSKLRTIVFPESVLTIGTSVLNGNTNLISILFPEGVTSIGTIYNCAVEYVELPSSLLSFGGFSSCKSLKEIRIPPSCTTLTGSVAMYAESVERILLPEGITSIPSMSFYHCINLPEIKLPDSLETLGDNAFSGCVELSEITIPDGVTSLGLNTFASCTGLSSVTLHDGITTIGQNAFYGCSSLTSISLPASLSTIGQSAFESCSSLIDIYIRSSFSSGTKCFKSCPSGRRYYVDNLSMWLNITDLYNLTNGDSHTYRLFVDNKELTSFDCSRHLPKGVSLSSYCFAKCQSIRSAIFSYSKDVESIPDGCFYGCYNLSSFDLNPYSSIKSIGSHAFAICALTELSFGAVLEVNEIGWCAFDANPFVSILFCLLTPPHLGDDALGDGDCPIYIRNEWGAYNEADSWSQYRDRLEWDGDD